MSSPDEDAPTDAQRGGAKRRKVLQRACDYCRRKKIKCDGPRMPNKRCSKCVSLRAECTYVEPFNKPRYPDSYVENLERRLQRMEEVLSKLNPDAEVLKTLGGETGRDSSHKSPSENAPSPSSAASPSSLRVPPVSIAPSSPESLDDEDEFSDHDEVMRKEIVNGMSRLTLQPASLRYHGKSSGWVFIQAAESFRQEYIREAAPASGPPEFIYNRNPGGKTYDRQPWIERPLQWRLLSPEDFPPADLIDTLVKNYFRHSNDYAPLLHEPSFFQNIKEGMHLHVPGFGATVLLACALGARHSSDRRVLLPGTEMWQSAGWKWFQRVDEMHKSMLAPVHVYDVQICALATFYVYTTTLPHCSWITVGLGLRRAMDVGSHRKSMYKVKPTVEDELWRRAFWALLACEWGGSYGLGRPPCIHEEEYDVTLPTDCDDEYWVNEDPDLAFKQPPGKPSKVTFWICSLRLWKIVAYVTRTIFSIRKSRAQMDNGDNQWEDRIVAELDSELNRWADTVPQHLKWDPKREDGLWLRQSATLYALFYQVQLTVHRSSITSRRGSPQALASLIICTNAARSCVKVLYELYERIGTPLARNSGALFNAGIVLLISMWGQKRSGRNSGADRDEEWIRKAVEMLNSIGRQANVSSRLGDMLQNFMTVDLPRNPQPGSPSRPQADSQSDPGTGSDAGAATINSRDSDGGDTARAEGPSAPTQAPAPDLLSSPFAGPSSQQSFQPTSSSSGPSGSNVQPYPSTSTFTFTPPHNPSFPRLPDNPLPPSWTPPASWQPDPEQSAQPSSSSSTSQSTSMPSFNFPPLDPSSQAWGSGAGTSFGASGQSMAAPSSNLNAAPSNPASFGGFGFGDGGGELPMDLSGFGGNDFGLPDCAFVDDTMTMWSNAPATFGWQDWDAYFNTMSGAQQQTGG